MKTSAGILLYRVVKSRLEVLLVHPGGPFWKNKDQGAWSIPKGEFCEGEDPLATARREFKEETGSAIDGDFIELKPVKQKSGKLVYAWAVEGKLDVRTIKSNLIKINWPPKSNRQIEIPEIDRGEWFCIDEALIKINQSQALLIKQLVETLESAQ